MPRVFIVLCCLVSLSLSGCSDSSSSSASSDPPSPTPSSSSPSPSPTEEPETPEEFVRRWVDADTEMQNTGDGEDYRGMSAKCKSCLEYADYIVGIWKAGGYIETRGWIIRSSKASGPLTKGMRDVTIDVISTAAEFVEEAGGPVQHYERHKLTYIVTLAPRTDSWITVTFAQVAE